MTYEDFYRERMYTSMALGGYEAKDGSVYHLDGGGNITREWFEPNPNGVPRFGDGGGGKTKSENIGKIDPPEKKMTLKELASPESKLLGFKQNPSIFTSKPAQSGGGYSNFDFASDIVGGFGLGVDLGAYRWDIFSNKRQWKSSYKIHQYFKGKGYNMKTSTIKNAIPKGFKATGIGLGIASGAITVGDVLYNSQINASHILDATITGVSFIPWFGWAISGGYFVGDMIHRRIYGYSIGDRLDNSVGGPVYNWDW